MRELRVKSFVTVMAIFLVGACGANPGKSQAGRRETSLPLLASSQTDQPCSPRILDGDAALQTLLRAKRLLVAGKLRDAHSLLQTHQFLDPGLEAQALIIKSSAAFRFRFNEPSKRVQAVRKYVLWLEFEFAKKKDDPLLVARLAEGYAINQETQSKAKMLLEDLAIRGAMPDAFGFASLARLRAQDGEDAAASDALNRCSEIAVRKTTCRLTR